LTNDIVTIKGRSNDTLEIILSEGVPYRKLRDSLLTKLNKSRSFFNGANPKVIVKGKCIPKAQQEDIKRILLMDYSLDDVKYEDFDVDKPVEQPDIGSSAPQERITLRKEDKVSNKVEIVSADYFDAQSIFISHTVRSGQRIECEGDIVVLGDVNPGAELIAGGSIAVMGTLRGLAHAGATGRKDVVISAYRLSPMQLRISSKAAVFPENGDADYPVLAQLKDGSIVIRPIMGKKI
jgi:septum site-determining protein MinC